MSSHSFESKELGTTDIFTALEDIIGPPTLLKGESIDRYKDLVSQVRNSIKPNDTIEEVWVHDFVALLWDMLRFRRWKTKLIRICAHEGLRPILKKLVADDRDPRDERALLLPSPADRLTDQWARCSPEALDKVSKILNDAEIDFESVMAQTMAVKLDEIERIDRLMTQNEIRRNALLREIDRRRLALAQRIMKDVEDISDAESEPPRPA
jgi:hypothetical protein